MSSTLSMMTDRNIHTIFQIMTVSFHVRMTYTQWRLGVVDGWGNGNNASNLSDIFPDRDICLFQVFFSKFIVKTAGKMKDELKSQKAGQHLDVEFPKDQKPQRRLRASPIHRRFIIHLCLQHVPRLSQGSDLVDAGRLAILLTPSIGGQLFRTHQGIWIFSSNKEVENLHSSGILLWSRVQAIWPYGSFYMAKEGPPVAHDLCLSLTGRISSL